MIPAEQFGQNVVAHLHYATGRPADEAASILQARLKDGSWKRAAGLWIELASCADEKNGIQGTYEALMAELARCITGAPISTELHDFLPSVFSQLIKSPATAASVGPLLGSMLSWLVQSAKAGDAGLVASILEVAQQQLSMAADLLEAQRESHIRDADQIEILEVLRQLLLMSATANERATEEAAESLRAAERRRRSELLRCFIPAVRWLLEKGAAELRRPERAALLPVVLECLVMEGKPAELQLALRYISLNSKPEQGFWRRHMPLFWSASEIALSQGASDALICELVSTMYRGSWYAEDCIYPLTQREHLPRAHEAILQGLFKDRFEVLRNREDRLHPAAWTALFQHLPSELEVPRFTYAAPLERALKVLAHHTGSEKSPVAALARWFPQPSPKNEIIDVLPGNATSTAPAQLKPWTEFLVSEWIRIHGFRPNHLQRLVDLAQAPGLSAPVATAIHHAIAAAPPTRDTPLALRILEEAGGTPETVRSVLALELQPPAFINRGSERLEQLRQEFLRILNLSWNEPVFGVEIGQMIQGLRDIQFAPLDQEDLVQRHDETLFLNAPPYQQMADTIEDGEEFLAIATLYFLHEWVHEQQGIGSKQTVDALRETGNESTLMHLDLAADHASALLTQRAVPRWPLSWLKDIQGRSLLNYAATRGHTFASRRRKTTRLASLRLDYFARVASSPPNWYGKIADGYVFSEVSPGGGAMVLLVSGPPVAVVGHTRLSTEQTALLTTAMDEREEMAGRLDEIDSLLRSHFRLW